MKAKYEGAAWDLAPDVNAVVAEPGSERSEFYQPEHMHPEYWPGNVMGFDYTGGAKVVPAATQTPAGSPSEAHEDDMRQKSDPEVNYDRLPNYPPQQVVGHDMFQLKVERPASRHRS